MSIAEGSGPRLTYIHLYQRSNGYPIVEKTKEFCGEVILVRLVSLNQLL